MIEFNKLFYLLLSTGTGSSILQFGNGTLTDYEQVMTLKHRDAISERKLNMWQNGIKYIPS